jgi:PAS domain-containing protein
MPLNRSLVSVVTCAFLVAILASMGLMALSRWAKESSSASLELVQMSSDLHALDALEWQAISKGSVDAALQHDASALFTHLDRVTPAEKKLRDAIAHYHRALEQEFKFLAVHDLAAAREVDAQQVDPSFEKLEKMIVARVALGKVEEQRVWHAVELGLVACVLSLAVFISMLFASLGRARSHHAQELGEALRRLQDSEQRWKFALEGANQAVWDWDLRSDKGYSSPRWQQLLGGSESDALNDSIANWKKQIHPEDLDAFNAAIAQPASAQETFEIQHRYLAPKGWIWVRTRGMPWQSV